MDEIKPNAFLRIIFKKLPKGTGEHQLFRHNAYDYGVHSSVPKTLEYQHANWDLSALINPEP
jgi:hypothetical protein